MLWISDEKPVIEEDEVEEIEAVADTGNAFSQYYKKSYETTSSLKDEISTAQNLYQSLNDKLAKSFEALRTDNKLDVKLIEAAVISTVESTIRNPVAFRLVLELQKQDKKFYNRSLGTSVWCAQIGRPLGLEKKDIYELSMGGMLLDIGKIKLPQDLLHKTEKPSEEEMELLRTHVDEGVRIMIRQDDVPHTVLRMLATHHERYDGSGYPGGLIGEDIPLFGQIAGLADSFDAMISSRPYTDNVHSPHEAISDLYNLKGTWFNADIIDQFIQTVGVYPA